MLNLISDARKMGEKKKRGKKSNSSDSTSSRISASSMEMMVQKLLAKQTRDSTTKTYCNIWHQFNRFLMKLDKIPRTWEQ